MADVLRLLRPGVGVPHDHSSMCAEALGVTGLAVSLVLEHGHTELVWCSGPESAAFEDVQFTLGTGPGPDAIRSGEAVLTPDLKTVSAQRWPALLAELNGHAVGSVFSFPLVVGAIRVGVMTMVQSSPHMLTQEQTSDALVLSYALTALFLGGRDQDEDPHVLRRAVVHQATGMVSVQLGVSLAEALLRLRGHAYSTGRPVGEIAEDVVARRLRLDDDENGPRSPEGERG
ncbi:GAF and ANTAR domain-containing protein [Streptomyces sp. NBC_01304]|uniref:GAF and ANTAR domain-containing protein n=1 Tax=Streptomyces sp. NBC_01304 TaxID=2903818 RepID=UPI002E11CD99|nr:GAF and ANTAR domain-containing protein [Streptomyces sp. NBC_01304]